MQQDLSKKAENLETEKIVSALADVATAKPVATSKLQGKDCVARDAARNDAEGLDPAIKHPSNGTGHGTTQQRPSLRRRSLWQPLGYKEKIVTLTYSLTMTQV